MSGRNRGPSNAIKGGAAHPGFPPQLHEPPFSRGAGAGSFLGMPHPALLEEMREREREAEFGRGGPLPLLPAHLMLEDRLAIQHQEIQGLLVDNQRLAATHVALKQELESSQHELQRMVHIVRSMQSEKDVHLQEAFEKSMRMEADLRAAEAMKGELSQVRSDIQKLSASKQDLQNQVQGITQDLAKANADLQQAPALKAEIESMKGVLQKARAAIEYEKKGYAENYEHGQAMENKLVSMARELEKLRAEVLNAEKRAQAAAAVGNTGPSYGGNTGASYGGNTGTGYGGNTNAGYGGNTSAGYGGNTSAGYGGNYSNPDSGYGANPYPAGYGVNPAHSGTEGNTQYGPGPGTWGGYDMQRARR